MHLHSLAKEKSNIVKTIIGQNGSHSWKNRQNKGCVQQIDVVQHRHIYMILEAMVYYTIHVSGDAPDEVSAET